MAIPASLPTSQSLAKLEPFLLLAKSAKGAAAAKLINEATAAQGCYVFAELADCQGVRELSQDANQAPAKNLLDLFQFGTLATYLASPQSFPRLSQSHINKLRQLTLVTLASQSRQLDYSQLLDALKLSVYVGENGVLEQNGVASASGSSGSSMADGQPPSDPSVIRALEDVIIDAMYAGLLSGKLDQRKKRLYVDSVIGRDVEGDGELAQMEQQLSEWNDTTTSVLAHLSDRIQFTRQESSYRTQERARYDETLVQTLLSLQQQQQSGKPGKSSAAEGVGVGDQEPGSWDDDMDLDGPDDPTDLRKSPSSKKKPKRTRN